MGGRGGFFGGRGGFSGRGGKGGSLGEGLRAPRWDLSRLPKFEKHFYHESPAVTNRALVCFLVSYFTLKEDTDPLNVKCDFAVPLFVLT